MGNPWLIDEWHILLRLLLAMLLGGLVGLERERSNHAAGLRTHILVCLGSALIMMLSIYGFKDFANELNVRIDPARLATAVITGVGFLGAGTILFTGKSITGLTTAASIWVVAAIGLAAGAGFFFASIVSTVLVLLNLWVFNKLELRYIRGNKLHVVTLHTLSEPGFLEQVSSFMEEEKIRIRKITVNEQDLAYAEMVAVERKVEIVLHVYMPHEFSTVQLVSKLRQWEHVTKVSIE
ncbi:MgtC/SapB family protein [Paenibacillus sp. JNUCC31]|uniref:MgtC/SapB family protein n=1 Tax=Paenibacillus sp. JNUCC-31 TaxID=2777983 RepID=UPI001783F14B|nr:MgtC/SapB family protein [Paenibacillus sp. JNUCC-31]QOS81077.1 MgtC/SapB family protein [Paenibacillus sp. JNUCC-31]